MRRELRAPGTEQSRIELLSWVAALGAVTARSVAIRGETTLPAARTALGALTREGLLVAERPVSSAPCLYVATRDGLAACGEDDLERPEVTATAASHLAACAAAPAALERCSRGHRVEGERVLRRDERRAGRPLASATLAVDGGGPRTLLHRPDLLLRPRAEASGANGSRADGSGVGGNGAPGIGADGSGAGGSGAGGSGAGGKRCTPPIAIEIELTLKAPRRLRAICEAWASCELVAGVVYLAAEDALRPLERTIAAVGAQTRIAVMPLDAVTAALPHRDAGSMLPVLEIGSPIAPAVSSSP